MENIKKKGPNTWKANCPVHGDEKTPDLEISKNHDKLLITCHACNANGKDLFKTLGIPEKYLFLDNMGDNPGASEGYERPRDADISVQKLARYKAIPADKLRDIGVYEQDGAVIIPYWKSNEAPARKQKRISLKGDNNFRWAGDDEPIIPYGLWRDENKRIDYNILVEGSSDCWTLWLHDYPAIGIPSASYTGKLRKEHIEHYSDLYCWREPDNAGEAFIEKLQARLGDISWRGRLFLIDGEDAGYKDPNELHKQEDNFEEIFDELLENAERIEIGRDWGKPSSFSSAEDKEQLPIDILPPWLADYAENLAENIQVPQDLPMMMILSAVSAAVAGKGLIEVRTEYKVPLNLWIMVLMDSAERKSPILKKVKKPIQEYETRQKEKLEDKVRKQEVRKETLQKKLNKLQTKYSNGKASMDEVMELEDEIAGTEIPTIPRILASDITPEKLVKLMAEQDGRLAVLTSENDLLAILAGKYKDGTPDFEGINKTWTGQEEIRTDRIGRDSIHIKNPTLTIGMAIQPAVIKYLTNKDQFREFGFLARFLYAIPETMRGKRIHITEKLPEFDKEAQKTFHKGMQVLLNTSPRDDGEPHILDLTRGALRVRDEFEQSFEDEIAPGGDLETIKRWIGKLAGNISRVAGLLHIADNVDAETGEPFNAWGKPVTKDAMERAVKLGRKLIPHTKEVFGLLGADPKIGLAKYVRNRIVKGKELERSGELEEKYNAEELNRAALYQLTKGKNEISSQDDLDEPLKILEEMNYIRLIEDPENKAKGRDRSKLIKLNPNYENDNKSPANIRNSNEKDQDVDVDLQGGRI